MFIGVLEDDERRREAMDRLLAESCPHHEPIFFDNAPDMIAWLPEHLSLLALLCLDHDLGPSRWRDGERFEPGTGRDVVDFLVQQEPCCPVIIHTTNYHAAPGMTLSLESAGWCVDRVVPFDDLAWLKEVWLPQVQERLRPVA